MGNRLHWGASRDASPEVLSEEFHTPGIGRSARVQESGLTVVIKVASGAPKLVVVSRLMGNCDEMPCV